VISRKEALILNLVVSKPEQYGLELVAASKGQLKRGTVYVTLGRMETKGLIKSRIDESPRPLGGMPRRLYSPTAAGRQVLKAWTSVARYLKPQFAQ